MRNLSNLSIINLLGAGRTTATSSFSAKVMKLLEGNSRNKFDGMSVFESSRGLAEDYDKILKIESCIKPFTAKKKLKHVLLLEMFYGYCLVSILASNLISNKQLSKNFPKLRVQDIRIKLRLFKKGYLLALADCYEKIKADSSKRAWSVPLSFENAIPYEWMALSFEAFFAKLLEREKERWDQLRLEGNDFKGIDAEDTSFMARYSEASHDWSKKQLQRSRKMIIQAGYTNIEYTKDRICLFVRAKIDHKINAKLRVINLIVGDHSNSILNLTEKRLSINHSMIFQKNLHMSWKY